MNEDKEDLRRVRTFHALLGVLMSTRDEYTGIPLSDIAEIIQNTFSPEEIKALIKELNA